MILQTVSINAAPRELHIKLFKVHGEEWEKLVQEIASLDAVALVSWARVFEAVKAPGVVAHWEVQHEIGGKAYTEQRITRICKESGLHSVFYSSYLPRRVYPSDGFTV